MARIQQIVPMVCVSGLVAWGGWLAAGAAIALENADGLMSVPAEEVGAIAQVPNEPAGYSILHVNAAAGDDAIGDGSQLRPFRTITHALALAEANTLILLARGTYSAASGETFPLQMQPGVTIQGMAGPNAAEVAIAGGGTYYSRTAGMQNVAILGADNAGLANVSVSNSHPEGTGLWVESGSPIVLENAFVQNGATGVYVVGTGAPVIRGNYFAGNGKTGLVIAGPSTAQVEANVFENTGIGIMVAPESAPSIINNRIFGNLDGLIMHADASPRLQGNQIARNRRNSIVDYAAWTTVTNERLPGATQPPPPTRATTAATARTMTAPPTGAIAPNPAAATMPAPPSVEAPVPAAQPAAIPPTASLPTAAPAAPPAESQPQPLATTPEPLPTEEAAAVEAATVETAPEIAAVPVPASNFDTLSGVALGDRLGQEISATTDALNAVEISWVPAIAATVALGNVDLLPLREAAETLSTEFEPEAAISVLPAATTELDETESTQAESDEAESDEAESDEAEVFAPLALSGDETPTAIAPTAASAIGSATAEVIEIAVIPPPETSLKPLNSSSPRGGLSQNLAYALETGEHLPAVPAVPNATATPAAPIPNSDRLAVPNRDIPLGSGGSSLPEVFTAGAAAGLPTDGPPPPPSLATSLGLNYKVLVAAADDAAQAVVRSQVPDAFRLRLNGQVYMQAGAYPTREEAQAMLNRLQQAGLSAQIQEIP
ncbi:DUF1565 domain-containing protein [Halomicronema sp. CCY15110]|uniref:DUF1565 domain-containing protein n=1 Tax=Halomicronema sp. CCY15110 TaxID=2767773 RepID=UPI001950E026|nr:DUF1565 domain-containing protein [Halomicronema sp. CCY15110]